MESQVTYLSVQVVQTAHERLLELEKINSPISDQINQASLFAGVSAHQARYHGRQEYALRWLLKRLQETEARQSPAAWRLLRRLIDAVPLRNLARILNEKKIVVILRQALEEAVATMSLLEDSSDTIGSSVKEITGTSALRKRKRSGNVSNRTHFRHREDNDVAEEWRLAVYETVNHIVQLSKPEPSSKDAFKSEYMKSAIRTSSNEAGRVLGAWMALCVSLQHPASIERDFSLLSPFLDIWDLRILDSADAKVFSTYCLNFTLTMMASVVQIPETVSQLEKLLARNVISPAKTAYRSSKDAAYLVDLVGSVLSANPSFAPLILDIAVRCIPPHGSRPREAGEAAWLQAVISALKEAMGTPLPEESILALNEVLQKCIGHKIVLELPFLRLITSQYGLPVGSTNWDLLATIIALDSNTFLIPSNPEDLLNDILVRITKAGTETTWPNLVDKVVDKVLVPLIREFSKARQLTVFIHKWYEQLSEFDKLQRSSRKPIEHFTAWEDDALRLILKELLEPSLTTLQILEVVDWLIDKLGDREGPVCVVLDAVVAAVSHEDTRSALYSRLIDKVINTIVYTGPDDRYQPQLLHLNTVMLDWSSWQNFEYTSMIDGNSPLFLSLLSSEISFPDRDHSLLALEAFRYLCAQWSIGAPRFWDGPPTVFQNGIGIEILSDHITSVASHVRKVIENIGEVRKLVEQRWEGRDITIKKNMGWLACAYASCMLVDYPQVLELCVEGEMLTDFIWIASCSTPSNSLHSEDPWLPLRHPGFPSLWIQMLQYDGFVENSKKISQNVIKRMIDCGTHAENPIERTKACNGFIVMCFHHLPLELLSKVNREAILKAWPPEVFDCSLIDTSSILYRMATCDFAVISLKAKLFELPSLYNGITFQELVDTAECIEASGREPEAQIGVFAEIPQLILGHVFATIDQPKSLQYIQGVKEAVEDWLQANQNTEKMLSYAMIRLVQVVLTVWRIKCTSSDKFPKGLEKITEQMLAIFKGLLLTNLQRRLQEPEKLTQNNDKHCLSMYSTMDALDAVEIQQNELIILQADMLSMLYSIKEVNSELGERLELFMTEHCPKNFAEAPAKLLRGSVATGNGRESIRRKALAVANCMTESEKLQLMNDLLAEVKAEEALDKLLALKHIIDSCEDLRTVTPEEDENVVAGLSLSYSALSKKLQNSMGVRQCWLICEIMEKVLREKPRTVTQYNIDSTLASITILCSHNGPSLDPACASTVYDHLVKLVNTLLTSHRLKLQGHFHILIQTLQSLLYCLFMPSSTGTYDSTKGYSFPPWLSPGPTTHFLGATHAKSYTRLLTLICDPSVSAVSRPSMSSLHSATKKAKALAGQHMPFVLSAYIRAQLDMSLSMKQEIREALVPGWYAVFNTMTVESRKALGEGLDASGRAILSDLVKDWVRFGKWNGA